MVPALGGFISVGRMDRKQMEYVRVSGGGDCAEESGVGV